MEMKQTRSRKSTAIERKEAATKKRKSTVRQAKAKKKKATTKPTTKKPVPPPSLDYPIETEDQSEEVHEDDVPQAKTPRNKNSQSPIDSPEEEEDGGGSKSSNYATEDEDESDHDNDAKQASFTPSVGKRNTRAPSKGNGGSRTNQSVGLNEKTQTVVPRTNQAIPAARDFGTTRQVGEAARGQAVLKLHGYEKEIPVRNLQEQKTLLLQQCIHTRVFPYAKFFRNVDEILHAGYMDLVWSSLGYSDHPHPTQNFTVSQRNARTRMWDVVMFGINAIMAKKRQTIFRTFKLNYDMVYKVDIITGVRDPEPLSSEQWLTLYNKVWGGQQIRKSEQEHFVSVFCLEFEALVSDALRRVKTTKKMDNRTYARLTNATDDALVFYMIKHYGVEGIRETPKQDTSDPSRTSTTAQQIIEDGDSLSKSNKGGSEKGVPKIVGKKLEDAIEYYFKMESLLMKIRMSAPKKRRGQINRWVKDAICGKEQPKEPAKDAGQQVAAIQQVMVSDAVVDANHIAQMRSINPHLKRVVADLGDVGEEEQDEDGGSEDDDDVLDDDEDSVVAHARKSATEI